MWFEFFVIAILLSCGWIYLWTSFTNAMDEVYANGGSLARQRKCKDGKYYR